MSKEKSYLQEFPQEVYDDGFARGRDMTILAMILIGCVVAMIYTAIDERNEYDDRVESCLVALEPGSDFVDSVKYTDTYITCEYANVSTGIPYTRVISVSVMKDE